MFRISVQWGQGYHYFFGGEYTKKDSAILAAKKEANRLRLKYKKGVKPTVKIWELSHEELL